MKMLAPPHPSLYIQHLSCFSYLHSQPELTTPLLEHNTCSYLAGKTPFGGNTLGVAVAPGAADRICVCCMGKESGGAVKLVLVGKAALRATRSLWDGGSGCWSSFLPISHCASSDAQWNRTHSVSPPRTATSGRSRAKRVERIASCDAFVEIKFKFKG